MLRGRSAPDPGNGPEGGPGLAAWPEQPAGPGSASGRWSAAHTESAPADWAGPEDGFSGQAESAPDNGSAGYAGSAANDWSGDDAGLRPGAVLGEGEWVVRAPEAAAEPGDWTVADPGLPAAGEPSLNLWPTPDPAPATAGPEASPAAGQPAQDEEPDDGPVHRVESAFNVWQRPDQDAGPAAAPAGAVAPGAVPPESVPAEPAAAEFVTAESAAPAPADQDRPAAAAPSTRDWVQHVAARLRDADLLPDVGPPPARGLRPPAHERPAEPADMPGPADSEVELDPITRPPAPRRSGPAPGWNPDSEEDWLRVLRGLRGSEDGTPGRLGSE